jgi:hypothetical protein
MIFNLLILVVALSVTAFMFKRGYDIGYLEATDRFREGCED